MCMYLLCVIVLRLKRAEFVCVEYEKENTISTQFGFGLLLDDRHEKDR